MSTKVDKIQHIEFDSASITHLSSILGIYNQKKGKTKRERNSKQDNVEDIMEHFGLPLNVAYFGKQMIGYGFVLVNSSREIEMNYHFDEQYDVSDIKKGLEKEVEKEFKILFNDADKKVDAVQNAIHKLENWINQC
ncbi:hypothetical protein OIU83_19170 [Flavobacterium sp. LS1R49]|uniref:Uncharacterized protein n=1 Tax=Flavobacterium shii TaxID=2987687 RepID=A0A9X2ZEC6_9FLAO|nr:hypothetical protein [Flavobacterium shii]MCV9929791.1 hypothetical protein [Flavobacterium shii]